MWRSRVDYSLLSYISVYICKDLYIFLYIYLYIFVYIPSSRIYVLSADNFVRIATV